MKKILLLAAGLFVVAINNSNGQGFYVKLGMGYAMPSAGQTMFETPIPYYEIPTGYNGTRTYSATSSSEAYNLKSASFGSGLQGYLSLGYELSRYVALELDANIGLATKKYTFTDENVPLTVSGGTSIPYNVSTEQQAKTPFILIPSLVIQSGGDKVNVYSRFGIALPLSTTVTQDQIFQNAAGTGALTTDDFTWQLKNSFSLGFSAAAGVKYKLSDRVSIWGELSILSLTINAKQDNLQTWTENGQSVALSSYGGPQTIKLSKKAVVDSTYSQMPTYSQPFSNVGINVGVTFRLSGGGYHDKRSRNNGQDLIDDNKPFRRR